jgi:hypothetical protein
MISAQVLGDLIRCTQYVVQALMIGHNQNFERLRKDTALPSVIPKHLMLNIQKERVVLISSLDILFRRSEVIASELTSYITDVQRAQEQLFLDCSLQSVL